MRTIRATKILCFLGFCSVLTPELQGQNKGLTVSKQWKELDWTYANEADRQAAIRNGEFVRGNGLPIDVDVYYGTDNDAKIFITVPRFLNGIPGTLNLVSSQQIDGNPLLQPYPSWDWNRNSASCHKDRLVSVFRVQMDECGRLWVLDTGKIESNQICNAQIIAFDPSTSRVLHRYEIPRDQIKETSILVTPVVDIRDPQAGCQDTFIYSADVTGFGLIVYDVRQKRSWRIENKLFFPIPDYGTFFIAGDTFDLMDGILGLALSPYHPGTDRTLYFHALASNTENHVYTSVIRNESIFQDHVDAVPREFNVYRKKRYSQAAAEAIDKNGVMYFGAANEISIMCWNIGTEFDQKNFDTVDGNKQTLQFASGVKIVTGRKGGQELWVLTDRIQKSYTDSFSSSEVNFRILAANTDNLIRHTKCKPRSGGNSNYIHRPPSSWGGTGSLSTSSYGNRLSNRDIGTSSSVSSAVYGTSAQSPPPGSSISDELVFN